MYKASLELGKVNKYLKLRFSVIIKNDNSMVKLFNKFKMNGNEYFKVSPIPMVTLEIKSNVDKHEEWSPNRSITFTKITKFIFCRRVGEILEKFKSKKELFYYQNDSLKLNKQVASSLKEMIRVSSKVCCIVPAVIPDEDTNEEFEGVILMINSPDYYCMLTFEEMEYLYDYLKNIDLDNLALNLINTNIMCKSIKPVELQKPRQIVQEKHEEYHEDSHFQLADKKSIPNI